MRSSFYKSRARYNLQNNWEAAIVAVLLGFLFFAGIDALFGRHYFDSNFLIFLFRIALQGPVLLGMALVFLSISRSNNTQASLIFKGFENWQKALFLVLLIIVFVALWSVLLFIPGIIAGLSYSMAFFVLADDPDISPSQALRRSRLMMHGHKTKLFFLILSFTGWFILSAITAGLLYIFYVGPLFYASLTEFYESLQETSRF